MADIRHLIIKWPQYQRKIIRFWWNSIHNSS